MSEIKEKIKKAIYKELKELPDNKVLLLPDLFAAFFLATGESLNNYSNELEEVIEELEKLKYIRFENFRMGRIIKGINFDEWIKLMEGKTSSVVIGSISASQVQVGNHNVITINNISPKDLIKILEIFVNDPERGKDMLSKLKESLSSVLSVSELIVKLYEIGKIFFGV